MTKLAVFFYSEEPKYQTTGNEWFLISSIDGGETYIPDYPEDIKENEYINGIVPTRHGIVIFTVRSYIHDLYGYNTDEHKVYLFDLKKEEWKSLVIDSVHGDEISFNLDRHDVLGNDYITFGLSSNYYNAPGRIVDLAADSLVAAYTALPDHIGTAYSRFLNSSFLESRGDLYSRSDLENPVNFNDYIERVFFSAEFDESGQPNFIYFYDAEDGSNIGVYRKVGSQQHEMIIKEEIKLHVYASARHVAMSFDKSIFVAHVANHITEENQIWFYSSNGTVLSKVIFPGEYFEIYTDSVSDDGKHAAVRVYNAQWEEGVYILSSSGEQFNLADKVGHLFTSEFEVYEGKFIPAQRSKEAPRFWTLLENTVEV